MLGEFELIERFFDRSKRVARGVTLGIGDDAALLEVPPGTELVAALDTIVAGRHFLTDASAHGIGHRALAVNLSDLAAMGATPLWALLGLTLPQADERWLEGFAAGWFELAERYGVALVGGDTTRGPLTISVQLSGCVERGTALRRDAGQPGDVLVVTGTLGDAAAGLAIAGGAEQPGTGAPRGGSAVQLAELRRRFEYPEPRVEFGRCARGIASAAMDLSDGIAGDLPRLAAASALAAHVDVRLLPLSEALLAVAPADQARRWALSGGDDYELLLAVAPARLVELQGVAGSCGLRLTAIGELRPGGGVTWSMDGAPMCGGPGGYDHFRVK